MGGSGVGTARERERESYTIFYCGGCWCCATKLGLPVFLW